MSDSTSKATVQNRTYENATLEISSRTIASNDYVMQIRNIAQAGIGDIPKKKASPGLIVLCLVVALVCLSIGTSGYRSNELPIAVALVAIGILLSHLYKVSKQPQQYGLTLELNSGASLFFVSESKGFLRDVLALIDERMQSPGVHQEIYLAQFGEKSIQNYHGGSGDIINGDNIIKQSTYLNDRQ